MKEIFEQIRNVVSERTGVEKSDIRPESSFMEDLNIDEMEVAEIISEIEDKLNIELDADISEIKTVGDLLHAIHDVME